MSNHKSLVFFNKEGDYLNVKYNDINDRFEGDLLFHESSSDVYKTYGLYTMESLPAFEYSVPGELKLDKFQLFNELGTHFYSGNTGTFSVKSIEPINNDPNFYSKWIYGTDFERLFPIGTFIMFDTNFLEFTDTKKTYMVIGSKKGAIMILSDLDNATFESTYYSNYTFGYNGDAIIRGANLIGSYNYIDSNYINNLSDWNETLFYDKYYDGKRLNIINSDYNDGVVTIKNSSVTDAIHFEYYTDNIPSDKNLVIELISRTDVPKIYDDGINITGNKIYFTNKNNYPKILKPGREFKIVGSNLNSNFLLVSQITKFIDNTTLTIYQVGDQVLYNNLVYECKLSYTHDHSDPNKKYITPDKNTNYWGKPTYTKVEQTLFDETLNSTQLYLTTDRLYFEQSYTQSSSTTLALASEKYKDDFKAFNIDLYTNNGTLKADLMYPSRYVDVNFYHTETVSSCLINLGDREDFIIKKAIELFNKPNDLSSTSSLTYNEYTQLSNLYDTEVNNCNSYSIGNVLQTNERLVEVKEKLVQELNYDYSENYRYNIVFTDLDEFGLKVIINKNVYDEEINWIYSGAAPDMERTIDRTLRNWLTRHYLRLRELGIITEVEYLGSYTSPFFNSIILKSEYPNIPIEITRIEVGTTANYHIEHSKVLFNEIGANLTFTINNVQYQTQTIFNTYLDNTGATVSATSASASVKIADIPKTLEKWVEEHSLVLESYGIIVSNINNLIKIDIKRIDRRLDYTINTGKLLLPGQTDYIITNKIKGNTGIIITGNEIILDSLSTESFEDVGFGTGRVVSINNTKYPLQDIKYNLLSVDPKSLNLSYQGPFWGTDQNPCKSSGFITLAFDLGFSQTTCINATGSTGVGGPFNSIQYNDQMFGISFNQNDYSTSNISLNLPGVENLIDLKYIQLANSIFVLGDNISVIDAYTSVYLSTIYLTENGIDNTDSIKMEFNVYNNYLYCLSKNKVWIVDPVMNTIIETIDLTSDAADLVSNPDNGDIYITYTNNPIISIYDSSNILNTTIITPALDTKTGKMVYNSFEKDMYVTTDADLVLRVDGTSRTIQTSYNIPGLTQSSIFYEPVNESIYVYAESQLWKIDNGITYSITGVTMSEFVDVIYNNLSGEMNISDKTYKFKSLNLNDDTINIDKLTGVYGDLAINQYDGGVYMASRITNQILTIDSISGTIVHVENTTSTNTKIIYNPERKSIWTLQPNIKNVYEVKSTVNSQVELIGVTGSLIDEGQYGTLDPNYTKPNDIWIKALECIRKPRENFEGEVPVKYYWKWLDDQSPEFFIYDLSGDQLEKTGPYVYLGEKPFKDVPLNKYPNRDINRIYSPEYQQTVFDKIEWELSYIDDQDDYSTEPSALELFIGFKGDEEGVYKSQLQLYKKEEVEFDIVSTSTNDTQLYFETISDSKGKRGQIKLNAMSVESFSDKGLKIGQYLGINIKDITNTKNQYSSQNSGYIVKIKELYTKSIIVDFFNINLDYFESESTVINNYPKTGDVTYLKTKFKVIDREIARFNTIAQTEIEDVRFKIELNNQGKTIGPNEVFIFKDYDIYEGGVDWNFLNHKRKELLFMKDLIYPYIGSYKSIINAINFFGYNDLQLNEYYRNIDVKSENFSKLFKVEIPDIFDNSVEGWTENDFIKHTFPNEKFEETNLLNLTYFITDKEGNKLLPYTIDEITIKLQGLKHWLKKNIIPLTHKILDITGRSYFTSGNQITHRVHDMRIIDIKENMTPITFKLNEAYLMPVNSGSTVYNCVLDFYTIMENIGADKNPTGLQPAPKPYFEWKENLRLPEYFTIKIRTYKTYREWAPFTNYQKGDKVTYYGKLYVSTIDNNKVKSPRKYEDVSEWNANDKYSVTSIVKYENEVFVYSGLGDKYDSKPPVLDQGDDHNWLNITEWKEISLEPVQTIDEYRKITTSQVTGASHSIVSMDDLGPHKTPVIAPFNFIIDSNIDPFITIEISSENGYGSLYRDRKNYEIRGLKDLQEPIGELDEIGPFQPIKTIY